MDHPRASADAIVGMQMGLLMHLARQDLIQTARRLGVRPDYLRQCLAGQARLSPTALVAATTGLGLDVHVGWFFLLQEPTRDDRYH
jgi:hypothetical protein